jgi:hypothetical protein
MNFQVGNFQKKIELGEKKPWRNLQQLKKIKLNKIIGELL